MVLIRNIDPIKPKLLENTANIKSVDASGKYIGVLLIPYPINPPLPIDVIPLLNWYPDPQSYNLLTLRKNDDPNSFINRFGLVK